ncbi:inhibitor of glucose uptake transporter SgrT [Enterobacter sp. BIGb0383]|uniref:glucose uptake inhibitor SgrT n=1 Tax=unclassified Enterobacter TaxID=2608935 RepID=UPI000F46D1E5|nr:MULTISPECIES: glucose uptake inhibitor SgrT [unclassified Enterobacter]ROP59811.1 inhibitor of glucose uptake transporter SgrT [Enterobacter sp. BIGb0383]ROS08720.1 inhibitor of glucose uptake transporter SgrT [Enterobacter sp. BIGb0359]
MKKSSARQFYQNYFTATRRTGWLTGLSAQQRLKMLEDLMQWSVTSPTSDR